MTSFISPDRMQLQINWGPMVYHCPPGWAWRPNPMPDFDIWFVEAGRGTIQHGNRETCLEVGHCFLWRPGDTPIGTQDENHRLVVFACHFLPLDSQGNVVPMAEIPYPIRIRDIPFFVASAHRIERLWRRDNPESRAAACTLLQNLLWQLEDESTNPPPLEDAIIQNLAASILARPGHDWTLEVMASTCHLSRAQFTRRFRAAHGTSPARFVINARVERARQLLLETDLTLEQIARSLDYSDVYFFARQFKTATGHAPGSLRRPRSYPRPSDSR